MRAAVKLGLLLALAGVGSSHAAARIFCCNDESGRQVCGDTLPAACYGRAYRELGDSGRTANVVAAPLTREQRAARAVEEKQRQERERLLNEQNRKDQALLNTYASLKDIEVLRSRAESELAASITAAEERIAEIRKHRQKFETEAEFYKNRSLPVGVAKGLRDADFEISALESVIESKKKDREVTRAKYDEDQRRFIEISKRPPVRH
ncbi:hypothetical protein [Accumulibacter sp.]|uniref:hypothetical protein n=1 Tax=Accumulibacter sp. TaxID=2053492 RepID=UPI0028C4DF3E|nr:hypothetical protein [Accumulibacter sp.]